MAVMANLARETVARALSQLRRNGILLNVAEGPSRQVVVVYKVPSRRSADRDGSTDARAAEEA